MNNAPAILRTLIIYAVIVPLALFIGYLLTNPLDSSTFTYVGILAAIMLFPALLRWHQPMLVLSWNTTVIAFLLPGRPHLWLVMAVVSLGITLLQRALGGVKQLISVPQVTGSLVCMIGVVVITARLTGMGLHAFGSDVSGGKRYAYLLVALMGYFALSTRRIPTEQAGVYVGLFFLGGLTSIVGDFYSVTPGFLQFIYWFFPPNTYAFQNTSANIQGMRFSGAAFGSVAIFSYMLAKYGVRGVFLAGKPWRWVLFSLAVVYSLFGGFRSGIAALFAIFALQFYLEGMHRTKLLPIFAFLGILAAVLLVPLAPHLPYSFQRILSSLPLQVDVQVRREAEDSSDWRFDMWKALLPEVPQHLLLGKGYAISRRDLDTLTGSDAAMHSFTGFEENQYFALAGSYHSGPLSVVMTFGIWGVITFVWFLAAGIWVLYRNYCYGDPTLRMVNRLLFATFCVRTIFFVVVFGDMGSDMQNFCGWVGLSVALNGGVCQPAPVPVQAANKLHSFRGIRPHLQPTLRRQ